MSPYLEALINDLKHQLASAATVEEVQALAGDLAEAQHDLAHAKNAVRHWKETIATLEAREAELKAQIAELEESDDDGDGDV